MKTLVGRGSVLVLLFALAGCKSEHASREDLSSEGDRTEAAASEGHHQSEPSMHQHDHQSGHASREMQDRQEPAGERPSLGMQVDLPVVKDNKGTEIRLETLRSNETRAGKIVVLTLWCTTCQSCRVIEHDFDEKAKEYEDKGVLFVMVASSYTDSPASVNQFQAKRELGFQVLMDPESEYARYFGTKLTTTTAVIDQQGRLRYFGGFPKAEDAVKNLLAGEAVAVPETRGFG
ncbi:MAG: TlpA disulfide reductase family protein [Planctomycetota bacterium]